MPHLRLLLVLSAPILLGLLAIWTEAPFIMTAGAPSGSKPWADAPMKLLETPQPVTDKVGWALSDDGASLDGSGKWVRPAYTIPSRRPTCST